MTPRFKGKPNFDFSLPCPLCGYKIQPNELMRLASHIIRGKGGRGTTWTARFLFGASIKSRNATKGSMCPV